MALPLTISTLLYCFNTAGEALLLQRNRPPNRGLWSPCGGKLNVAQGESPYACACREAEEEIGLKISPAHLHLTGLVSEHGYEGQSHWLMFLFEIKQPLTDLPPPHEEGLFGFFPISALNQLFLPQTDRDQIWPLFLKHRGGYFSAHCRCLSENEYLWTVEESILSNEAHR